MILIIIVNVISSRAGGGIIILVLIKQVHHLLYHRYMIFSFQLLCFFPTSDLSRSVFNEARLKSLYFIRTSLVWISMHTPTHTRTQSKRKTNRTYKHINYREATGDSRAELRSQTEILMCLHPSNPPSPWLSGHRATSDWVVLLSSRTRCSILHVTEEAEDFSI